MPSLAAWQRADDRIGRAKPQTRTYKRRLLVAEMFAWCSRSIGKCIASLFAMSVSAGADDAGARIRLELRYRVLRDNFEEMRIKVRDWKPEPDRDHRLRHVGRPPLPQRRARGVEEMAPRMNQVLEKARGQGVLIIHAPSAVAWTPYKDHPGRKLRPGGAEGEATCPTDIDKWCYKIPAEEKGKYPDRPDRRRRGRRSEGARRAGTRSSTAMGRNPQVAVEDRRSTC